MTPSVLSKQHERLLLHAKRDVFNTFLFHRSAVSRGQGSYGEQCAVYVCMFELRMRAFKL